MKKITPVSVVSLLLLIAGWVLGVSQKDEKSNALLEQGKKVYHSHCAECHGPAGLGDGPKAHELGFHPRDFALSAFKCRCTASGELPTDEDLLRTITNGMPGTPMRPFGSLSLHDRQALVQFIKTLSPAFAAKPQPKCIGLAPSIPMTEQTVHEGAQIYRVLNCWMCHGLQGRGDGPSSADLKDDWGRPIKAYNFTAGKRFKCGGDDPDLYRTMLTGMNGSPMPSYAEAMLFAGDSVTDFSPFKKAYGAGEEEKLAQYLRGEPTASALKELSPAARQALMEKRAWALIHYLKSLVAGSAK
ncbi:MAG TPA: cytochrome c [Acidobacteriota bacterium]|nr:cytochrome c [Acidobacteriota bacterium]